MKLTPLLMQQCTGCNDIMSTLSVESANNAIQLYGFDTVNRVGMWLANVGHETGGLRYRTELWGPTEAQMRYEGRGDLGNTQKGDGFRYRGRGWLQTTGRSNYRALRDRLMNRWPFMQVPDFEAQPDELAQPKWCAISAADYIDMNKVNRFADMDDFDGYCDMINRGRKTQVEGDANGYTDRLQLWQSAKPALILAGFPLQHQG
jgi:putative chitinase